MSWERIERDNPEALLGDDPYDLLAQALKQAVACYGADLKRKPSTFEIVKTFEQILKAHFHLISDSAQADLGALTFELKPKPES